MRLLFLFFSVLLCGLFTTPAFAQADYGGYVGALDTLTDADTTTYDLTVTGPKQEVSFEIDILKISGTVGGTINIYGSVNGTSFVTTALSTITITNGSVNYSYLRTTNGFKKYRVQIINAAGGVCSQRTYLLYRK